jgi:hypothetical protein
VHGALGHQRVPIKPQGKKSEATRWECLVVVASPIPSHPLTSSPATPPAQCPSHSPLRYHQRLLIELQEEKRSKTTRREHLISGSPTPTCSRLNLHPAGALLRARRFRTPTPSVKGRTIDRGATKGQCVVASSLSPCQLAPPSPTLASPPALCFAHSVLDHQ